LAHPKNERERRVGLFLVKVYSGFSTLFTRAPTLALLDGQRPLTSPHFYHAVSNTVSIPNPSFRPPERGRDPPLYILRQGSFFVLLPLCGLSPPRSRETSDVILQLCKTEPRMSSTNFLFALCRFLTSSCVADTFPSNEESTRAFYSLVLPAFQTFSIVAFSVFPTIVR